MSARHASLIALLVAAGCGSLPVEPDGGPADGPTPPPPGTTVYRGQLQMIPAVAFGGNGGEGMNFCDYSVALSQVELEISISTTGVVTGATSQALAVEKITGPGPPNCSPGDGIPPNIHKFTLKSATPSGSGHMLVMEGAATNMPLSSLVITLTPSSGAYNAAARWTRLNDLPILTWMINASMTVTVK
jgi:hypothetical protein